MILIGVTGFRRAGKNSTTAILDRYGFKQYAFADALREMSAAVNPVISLKDARPSLVADLRASAGYYDEYRYNDIVKALGYERAKDLPDFRGFLQKLGTEGVRTIFGPNAWVNALELKVNQAKFDRVCISDVRFRSEADWVHKNGGVVWRINRPGWGGDDPHPSEAEVPHLPVDRDITAQTLDDLEREVINAIEVDLKRLGND